MLKRKVAKLEDVDAKWRDLYEEKDGEFHLSIEGDDGADAGALRKERDRNKALQAEMRQIKEALGDADPKALKGLKARLEELEQERELAGKSAEERLRLEQERIAKDRMREREQFQTELQKATTERDRLAATLKHEKISNALTKAAGKLGVREYYLDDVLLRVGEFDEVDNQIVAVETVDGERVPRRHPDDNRKYMGPEEYLGIMRANKPDWYRPNAGGGAGGGDTRRAPNSKEVRRDDPASILANLEGLAKGDVRLSS